MEAMTSRSDAQLAQRAIRLGWDLSEAEKAEIKNVALALIRHKNAKARVRGVSLCVAMEGQNIKLEKMTQEQEQPKVPQVLVQNNRITVSPQAIAATLAHMRKPEVIDGHCLSDQAQEGPQDVSQEARQAPLGVRVSR